MTIRGTRKHEGRFDFLKASTNDFTSDVSTNGTVTAGATGFVASVADDTAHAGVLISSLPFELDRLEYLEFLFKVANPDDDVNVYLGIADSIGADPDTVARSAWAKINNLAVSLEYDDTTNDVAVASGESIVADTWQRLRLNFWEQTQTVSPPSLSKGYQMTAKLTNSDGYDRKLQVQSTIDLSSISGSSISPIAMIKNASGGSASPAAELHLQEICYGLKSVA